MFDSRFPGPPEAASLPDGLLAGMLAPLAGHRSSFSPPAAGSKTGGTSKSRPPATAPGIAWKNFAFSEVIERVSDAIVALDRTWHYTFVNAEAGRLFGRRPEDLLGKHIWTEFPSGVGQKFHLAYEKALADQRPLAIEEFYPPFDRWFENRIFPSPAGLTIYFHDITARKHAEQLLAGQVEVLEAISRGASRTESLELLVRMIEAQAKGLLGSVLLLDADGAHLHHGAAPSLPPDYIRAIDGGAVGPRAGSCGTAAFRREPVFVENIATDPLWTEWTALASAHGFRACWSTPIFNAERRVLGTFAIYHRECGRPAAHHLKLIETATHLAAIVIERAQNAAELREAEASLRAATQAGRVGIWERNLASEQIVWSEITAVMLGFPRHKLGGTLDEFKACLHPDDRHELLQAMRRAIENRTSYAQEFRVVWMDGSVHWIAGRAEIICDASGAALRLVGVATEVTERKHSEDERVALTSQLRAVAGRLESVREEERIRIAREIHDVLAQQLTAVKIDLAWVAKRVGGPIESSQRPAVIARVAEATAQTDAAIGAVQKIATELRPVILDQLGLGAAIEWLAEEFTRRTAIACRVRVPADDERLEPAHATALFRIVQESLTNVARHAQATAVEVSLTVETGMLTLTVRDNGIGITVDQVTNPRSLGLVGIRERLIALAGAVEFRGKAKQGTAVTVRTPLARPASSSMVPFVARSRRPVGAAKTSAMRRVLIADDHEVLRHGLKQIIVNALTSVMFGEAANVEEAMARLRAETWDVMILDLNMPGRTGFEVLAQLRQVAPRLPVLVLSSTPEDQLGVRALRAGAAGYLNKQAAPEQLMTALQKLWSGGRFISPTLRARLAREPKRGPQNTGHAALSDRELQVFQLTASGRSVKDIATELKLSAKTISTFRRRTFEKLGVTNNVELLHYAREHGLLPTA